MATEIMMQAEEDQRSRGIALRAKGWSIWNMGGDCLCWGKALDCEGDAYFQIVHPLDAPMLPERRADVRVFLTRDDEDEPTLVFRGSLDLALVWCERIERALVEEAGNDNPDKVDPDVALVMALVDLAPIEQVRDFLRGFHDEDEDHWTEGTDEEDRKVAVTTFLEGMEAECVENLQAVANMLAPGKV